MSNPKTLFSNALKEAVCADYRFVPTENEISHSFSESFLRKIKKIKIYNDFFISSQTKKVIALLAAVIFIITLVSCTVPEVREKIQNFFVAAYSYYFNVTWKTGESADTLEVFYAPSYIPDGYTEIDRETDQEKAIIVYERNEASSAYAKIIFTQSLIPDDGIKLSKEYGRPDTVELDGITILIQTNPTVTIAYAEYKGYLFTVECSENATADDAIEMIKALEIIK